MLSESSIAQHWYGRELFSGKVPPNNGFYSLPSISRARSVYLLCLYLDAFASFRNPVGSQGKMIMAGAKFPNLLPR